MEFVSIIIALVLAFIAYKVLAGLLRVGIIIVIVGALALLWTQGVIA